MDNTDPYRVIQKNAVWFTCTEGCTGIVRVVYLSGDVAYYIGRVSGHDEEKDMNYVAEWGAKFPREAGRALFPEFDQRTDARD